MALSKSESKYLNTAHLMDEALLKLLEDKEFDFITIKDVCKKAGVNRSTFYLHYESLVDLLNEAIEFKNSNFWSYFGEKKLDINNSKKEDLILINKTYLIPYLSYIKDNNYIFKIAFKHVDVLQSKKMFHGLYKNIFSPIMSKFSIKEEDKIYVISYFIHGISAIVTQWIEDGCKVSIDHISDLIISLIPLERVI